MQGNMTDFAETSIYRGPEVLTILANESCFHRKQALYSLQNCCCPVDCKIEEAGKKQDEKNITARPRELMN